MMPLGNSVQQMHKLRLTFHDPTCSISNLIVLIYRQYRGYLYAALDSDAKSHDWLRTLDSGHLVGYKLFYAH